jgi:hypothetical protein
LLCAGSEIASPEEAQSIAQEFCNAYRELVDFQLRFESDRWAKGDEEGPAARRWREAFYAYKRGGYELLRYREWNGRQRRKFKFVYAMTPDELRGFQEDIKYGIRQGGIRPPLMVNFRVYCSPGRLLLVPFIHERVRWWLMRGHYVVRLPDGTGGDAELIAPVWPKGEDDDQRPRDVYILTLSREHNYAPMRFEQYRGERKLCEWELKELFEAEPGIWFPREVRGRQLPNKAYPEGLEFELKVDVLSVKVNSGLEPEFFTFEFPPGTRVYDRITQERYVVGMDEADAEARLKLLAARADELAGPPRPLRRRRAGWTSTDTLVAACALVFLSMFVAGVVLALKGRKG